jgi:hypothetical protein
MVAPFKKSVAIHRRFDKFIKFFYWEFRRNKGILDHQYPIIKFEGFKEFEDPVNESTAGHCDSDPKEKPGVIIMKISLNH